ncbi:MAG: helix-turn-helix transcriptional regulator [Methylophilus sp.]|nr:helix-turn-helix transcriptional regulator [Methylophilus sp.]
MLILFLTGVNAMSGKINQAIVISNNIKRLRANLDWNQARLAQEAEISGAALSKIEGGERIPTIVVLRKLSSALKVPLSEITGEESIQTTETDERSREFYRKWGVLDDLTSEDHKLLMGMAERLKAVSREE